MALTSEDIKKLQEVLATKEDIKAVRGDIASIQADLIAHDQRAETFAANVLSMHELQTKVEKIRQFLREHHNVEI